MSRTYAHSRRQVRASRLHYAASVAAPLLVETGWEVSKLGESLLKQGGKEREDSLPPFSSHQAAGPSDGGVSAWGAHLLAHRAGARIWRRAQGGSVPPGSAWPHTCSPSGPYCIMGRLCVRPLEVPIFKVEET